MQKRIVIFLLFILGVAQLASATPPWQTLPSTPRLPHPNISGYASINNVRIWYAVFGQGMPVILLHGSLANSNYWGYQVPVLAKKYQVIVMDSRGQGRSTRNNQPYSYSLMASDVLALMDYLKIKRAAIVGWSDGAIIGLDIVIHHPERVTKLFAFGANSDPHGIKEDIAHNILLKAYGARAKKEYEKLSKTPTQFEKLAKDLDQLMAIDPHFTKEQLNSITVHTWIVDGDHDEGIKREDTEWMAAQIPGGGLLLQPEVSHFSFLQDPQQFNSDVLHFLEY